MRYLPGYPFLEIVIEDYHTDSLRSFICYYGHFTLWEFQVFGGFLMLCIKFIAFARYPPSRPDTSQDGGLVGLHPFESRKLRELLILTSAVCCEFRFSRILHFIVISYIMFSLKEMLLRRRRVQNVLYMHFIPFKVCW